MGNFLLNLLGLKDKGTCCRFFQARRRRLLGREINLAPRPYLTKYGVSLVKRTQFYTWFASETMDKREISRFCDSTTRWSADHPITLVPVTFSPRSFSVLLGHPFLLRPPSINPSISIGPEEWSRPNIQEKKSQQKEEKKVHFLNRNYSDDDRFLSLHWFQLIDYFFDHFFSPSLLPAVRIFYSS